MDPEQMQHFMALALREAEEAFEQNEVPIGAIIVHNNRVIGRGYNRTEALHDATAHAEMMALSAAFNYFGDWRLEDSWLFSTIEPCTMCAGAASLARVGTIVYGAPDPKFGACGSIFDVPNEKKLNHRIQVYRGILAEQAIELMQSFFRKARAEKGGIN
jgi:tRNA(adenine34) deaminase